MAPTTSCGITAAERFDGIVVALANEFDDTASAQYQALQWLVNDDALQLCPSSTSLVQRYALVVLYYQTGGSNWTRCGGSLDTVEACPGELFLSATSECLWGGIVCDAASRVTAIHLDSNNLVGPLPSELALLTDLIDLDLDENGLTRSIPSSLGQLAFLQIIDLDHNALTGRIPEELYNAVSLEVLDLDFNALTGTISSSIGALSRLYYFQVDHNKMTGSIPAVLGMALADLQYISLYDNAFTSLPESLCVNGTSSGLTRTLYADCEICVVADCCTVCML
jgi:Leucine-rich repeat (LRR) protein